MTTDSTPTPTSFDWRVYADATFAGLSVLIPIPLVDWFFERTFRRRMPGQIGRAQGQKLSSEIVTEINREPHGCGCLWWPLTITLEFFKRLYRTVLYFLTINAAVNALSYYWHRAYLINYMVANGHLSSPGETRIARLAMTETLENGATSPLTQLARQVVDNARHIWRTLRQVRKGNEDEVVSESRSIMDERWAEADSYLSRVALQYQTTYERLLAAEVAVKEESDHGEGNQALSTG